MSRSARQRNNNIFRLILSLLLLLGAFYVFLHRQQLLDQYYVSQYQPSPSIVAIAERAAFKDEGTFLFYASRPELLTRDSFNEACRSSQTERTAILGCYSGSRIYLFDIGDQRLDGVKEVTAAHEMLHAVYDRMSPQEKERVGVLLEAQPLGEDEGRIRDLLAEYAKTEPGERLNELHSIIGSEVDNLTPELQAYYDTYFENRAQLLVLAKSYQSVFDDLKSRQESLVTELNDLADTIDRDSAVYKRSLQVLGSDIETFNDEASSGTMPRDEYETRRASLEARQAALRRTYDSIQELTEEYEQKRSELAAINSESVALNRSINSSLTPVPDAIDG